MLPNKLQNKIDKRKDDNSLRVLGPSPFGGGREGDFSGYSPFGGVRDGDLADFSSNDYLGFAKNQAIFSRAGQILKEQNLQQNGATGSRLLSGNHKLYQLAEDFLAETHNVEAALIFNSGYDANVGFFSSVPQRGDLILYDEFIHTSIRDGMQMSLAKAYKFKHNDLGDLEKKCQAERSRSLLENEIYVVTESVFSMDGDSPQLRKMANICQKYNARLVIDEAHAVGVLGKKNLGLVQEVGLNRQVFARLITFGKALGCHGAAILGEADLKSYLVNFARSFIYTTALPPHGVATILAAYEKLVENESKLPSEYQKLAQNIRFFNQKTAYFNLKSVIITSKSAIQSVIVPGNEQVKSLSRKLKVAGFEVKAIVSPTVPKGRERLRFCLHSYNSEAEIIEVLKLLCQLLKNLPSLAESEQEQ